MVDTTPPPEQPAATPIATDELHLALENTSTALILINTDTTIAAVNAAFEKMSGYPRQEIEGKKSWIEFVAKEDQPRLKRYYLLRRLDPASAPNTYEFKFIDREGKLKDVLINITNVPATDRQAATLLDVAEYKQAMQEAQAPVPQPVEPERQPAPAEDDKYLAYLDAMPDSVVVVDTEGIITYASRKAIKVMANGIASDMVGKNYLLFVRPGLIEDANESFRRLLQTGSLKNMEVEMVRTDGKLSPSEMSARLITDESGEPAGAIYVFKDMRGRKSIENSRKKSEELYRLLAEHMTDVVWIMDRKLHIIWLSDSSEKLRGFTNAETKFMPLHKLVTEESWERAMEFYETALREEAEHKWPPNHIYSLDLEMIHKNGSTVWTENKFQIIRDAEGDATGFIGWGRDISERRRAEMGRAESEKYFRLLAENSSDVVVLVDMDFKPVWISPSAEKLTGFTIEELRVMPLDKVATYDTLQKAMYMYWTAIQENEKGELPPDAILNLDIEVCSKDGLTLWCECKFRFIRDEQGKAIAIIGQGRDITERKKAEENA